MTAAKPDMRAKRREPETGQDETRAGLPEVIYLDDQRQAGRKKVTSGSSKRQRSIAILVRVHPADAARLKEEAAAAGISVAGYLASGRLGTEAAARPRIYRRRVRADVSAYLQGVVEFRRNNTLLNQQTHAVNTAMLLAEQYGAEVLAKKVDEWRRSLDLMREQNAVPLAAIQAALDDEHEG
jgi:hypothetical protein